MKQKMWSAGIAIVFVIMVLGCSFIQKMTTATIPVTQMCNEENIGKTVRVVGIVGRRDDTDSVRTENGNVANPYYLSEKLKTQQESKDEYDKTGKLTYPNERVLLTYGINNNQVQDRAGDAQSSTIKTNSGEIVPLVSQLSLVGKVVRTPNQKNPTSVCYLQVTTIDKP